MVPVSHSTRRATGSRAHMRLAVLACMLALVTTLAGCGAVRQLGRANVPDQYVFASVPGNFRANAAVSIHRAAADNRQTWTQDSLFLSGTGPNVDTINGNVPFRTAIYGRGGGSPGIASDGNIYVMAFWGRPSTVAIDRTSVALFASVSHDGIAWTVPAPVTTSSMVHSNASGIDVRAGVSVASIGANGPWFASFGDSTGAITVVPLPVDGAGRINTSIPTTPVTIPGALSNRAPALADLDGSLVLAWRERGSGGALRLLRSTDGVTWPAATSAATALTSGGGPLVIEDSAPFLHRSNLALILSSTAFVPSTTGTGNAARARLHSSTDGVTFTEVASVMIPDPLIEGTAAAGPAPTQYVLSVPRPRRTGTLVFSSGVTDRTLATNTARRITVAGGP